MYYPLGYYNACVCIYYPDGKWRCLCETHLYYAYEYGTPTGLNINMNLFGNTVRTDCGVCFHPISRESYVPQMHVLPSQKNYEKRIDKKVKLAACKYKHNRYKQRARRTK